MSTRGTGSGIPSWDDPADGIGHLNALIPLFFACVFIIYFLLEATLIPLMVASRWLVLFGAAGFLTLYAFRKPMRLDLTDGLLLSIFGIAPLLMAAMLTINWYFSIPVVESYGITYISELGDKAELSLQDDAYHEFYRVRVVDTENMGRPASITYFFAEGLLGWKVKKGYVLK